MKELNFCTREISVNDMQDERSLLLLTIGSTATGATTIANTFKTLSLCPGSPKLGQGSLKFSKSMSELRA
ncbi:hypothetical protein CAJAP_05195 [Camponotus japonicus]